MAYKTILVHLSDETHAEGLLRVARRIARANGAHLIGLAVMPLVEGPGRRDTATAALLTKYRDAVRADAARIEAIFNAKDPAATYTSEWRLADTGFERVADAIARHGQVADLIVVSQDDPHWQSSGLMRDSAGLVGLLAGRPVLVVPHERNVDNMGERILVAWNGSREATRAVFDALPMLQAASTVTVLSIQSPEDREATSVSGYSQGEDLCGALARHGVKCELVVEEPASAGVSANVLAAIERHKAGLLVMGDYGRSRISEIIFGGATRTLLRDMTIPVLLSH